MLMKGNHTLVMKYTGILHKNIKQRVKFCYQHPFSPTIINLIPNPVELTYGTTTQTTFNENSDVIPKHRIAHDLSFEKSPHSSHKNFGLVESCLSLSIDSIYAVLHTMPIHCFFRAHGRTFSYQR